MPKRREQDDREKAARALCRHAGIPENATRNGRSLWEDFLPEADAVLKAIGWGDQKHEND